MRRLHSSGPRALTWLWRSWKPPSLQPIGHGPRHDPRHTRLGPRPHSCCFRVPPSSPTRFSKGELLNITLEPTFQGGVAVNGFPIKVANQSTSDRKSMLHIVDGLLVPPSQQAILDFWIQAAAAAANGSASASAGANASTAAGSGGGALPGVPARSGAGAGHGALPALVALAVGALALLA